MFNFRIVVGLYFPGKSLQLELPDFKTRKQKNGTYGSAVFLHRVCKFVAFGFTSWEKAILTHVKVEAPETSVPEKYEKKKPVMEFTEVFFG